MKIEISFRTLTYKKPARTSRGEYTTHDAWYITFVDEQSGMKGVGECAPLPDLSFDRNAYPNAEAVHRLVVNSLLMGDISEYLRPYPALRFAMESALMEYNRDSTLFDTPFAKGLEGIPFNGLIWMSSFDDMLSQVKAKIEQGFHCVKLKIGAIDWEQEVELIRYIRSHFSRDVIELRVDANCAFTPETVEQKLETLARYDIHSIEQPVACKQWELLRHLCSTSPLPIALDEELIGLNFQEEKRELLDAVRPQYIVIKPTLHGGISGAREWVKEANDRGIGSWLTSALESNIGLRHVALLAASLYGPGISFPQGLGTGQLFTSNFDSDIVNDGTRLYNRVS